MSNTKFVNDDPRLEPAPFRGGVGDTVEDSTPWWPPAIRPRDGAPNVVMIVLDDVGFAQLGCYGSSIATPHIDALADGGVRYTQLPRHSPVLPHEGESADRAQPPLCRHGLPRRVRYRLPELSRRGDPGRGDHRRGAGALPATAPMRWGSGT